MSCRISPRKERSVSWSPPSAVSRLSSLPASMSRSRGASPYGQLAAWRRIVVIMNLTFCCPWVRVRTRATTSSRSSCRRCCSGGELDRQRFRLPGRELPDIPAAGPVYHRAEGVEFLQRPDEADSARVIDPLLSQSVVDTLKHRRLPQKEAAPLGSCGLVHAGARFALPTIPGGAAMPHGRVDKPIGRGHLFEARTVDHKVRPENVEQRKEVLATQLDRSGGEKDGGQRVVAEVAHGLVEVRLRGYGYGAPRRR